MVLEDFVFVFLFLLVNFRFAKKKKKKSLVLVTRSVSKKTHFSREKRAVSIQRVERATTKFEP